MLIEQAHVQLTATVCTCTLSSGETYTSVTFSPGAPAQPTSRESGGLRRVEGCSVEIAVRRPDERVGSNRARTMPRVSTRRTLLERGGGCEQVY